LLLDGAGTRRLPPTSEGALKATTFVAISEGLRVKNATFRAMSAGIGREIGGSSTTVSTAKRHGGRGVFVNFLRGGAFFGRLVGGGRAMVKRGPFVVASM
jgi:hypothetical protein